MSTDFNSNSRSGYRAKRKKTNLVLNSLIVIVLLLIIFVAYNIFSSGNDKKALPTKQGTNTEQKGTENNNSHDQKQNDTAAQDDPASDPASSDSNAGDGQQSVDASTTEKPDDSQAVVSEGGSSTNVLKTIENPSWKAVGTTQSGQHTPVFSGVDWDEMLNAISYATSLDKGNMKVYWLGSDKNTTNAAIGTVFSTDKTQKYRVYIKWVDGEGWMPTKVEELAELQK